MNRRKKIILVDDDNASLEMGKNILNDFYDVFPVQTTNGLFKLLYNVIPDLILLEINMPEMNGCETIVTLKSDPRFVDLPVLFLTAKSDEEAEHKGLMLGAQDFVTKPFSAPILKKRIENIFAGISQREELNNLRNNFLDLVWQKTRQDMDIQNSVLSVVAEMVEKRENVPDGHVARTQKYLEIMLKQLIADKIYAAEIASWDLDQVYSSAKLHDVGKLAISDVILNKPGKLTAEEFDEMKRHPTVGAESLRKIEHSIDHDAFMKHAVVIAGTHHERWDGSGYPGGLSGADIPLEGRLMAIADVYDALISTKPYKKAFTSAEAEREISKGSGTHFDPVLVETFQKVAPQFAQVATRFRQ